MEYRRGRIPEQYRRWGSLARLARFREIGGRRDGFGSSCDIERLVRDDWRLSPAPVPRQLVGNSLLSRRYLRFALCFRPVLSSAFLVSRFARRWRSNASLRHLLLTCRLASLRRLRPIHRRILSATSGHHSCHGYQRHWYAPA